MLRILSLTFFILLQNPNEKYYIIHLKGNIINKATGKALKIGDQIYSNEEIKFSSKDAVAVVISSQRGRFTLKPSPATPKNGEFIFLVKSVILPLKTNGNLSTRGESNTTINDLKSYFGSEKFYIIGDKLAINFQNTKYPISENSFFVYRYETEGQVISKKLESKDSKLIFDKKALYTYKDKLISPENINGVDIYYFNKKAQTSEKILSFQPFFLQEDSLINELQTQINFYKNQGINKTQINNEIFSFMNDVYGNTDFTTLESIISKLTDN